MIYSSLVSVSSTWEQYSMMMDCLMGMTCQMLFVVLISLRKFNRSGSQKFHPNHPWIVNQFKEFSLLAFLPSKYSLILCKPGTKELLYIVKNQFSRKQSHKAIRGAYNSKLRRSRRIDNEQGRMMFEEETIPSISPLFRFWNDGPGSGSLDLFILPSQNILRRKMDESWN